MHRAVPVLPGLAVVALLTALAQVVDGAAGPLGAASAAVLLGALLANTGLHRPSLRPGTRFASRRVLRLAVVLLGLQLALPQLLALGAGGLAVVVVAVAVTFTGTRALGRLMGLSPARSLLIGTGVAVCGASAVAAMAPVADGRPEDVEEDAAVATALVLLCGSAAIVVLPLLREPLGLGPAAFGAWVGASVHDVGQTVATAARVPGALEPAVVVKLARVLLLAPLVALVALAARRRGPSPGPSSGASDARPAAVPLFVAGFVLAAAVASTGLLPDAVLRVAAGVQRVLLVAALVGLGTSLHARALRRTGGRSLVLALASWLLVSTVAYAGVRLLAG